MRMLINLLMGIYNNCVGALRAPLTAKLSSSIRSYAVEYSAKMDYSR